MCDVWCSNFGLVEVVVYSDLPTMAIVWEVSNRHACTLDSGNQTCKFQWHVSVVFFTENILINKRPLSSPIMTYKVKCRPL